MKPGTNAFYKKHEAQAVNECMNYLNAFYPSASFLGRRRIFKHVLQKAFLAGRVAGVEGVIGALGLDKKGVK